MLRIAAITIFTFLILSYQSWSAVNISPTVNSLTDSTDANPGDGICADAPAGNCTLRAAVMECNAYIAGYCNPIPLPAGIIQLSPGIPGSASDTSGDLDLAKSLTFYGAGTDPATAPTIIDGGQIARIFQRHSSWYTLSL